MLSPAITPLPRKNPPLGMRMWLGRWMRSSLDSEGEPTANGEKLINKTIQSFFRKRKEDSGIFSKA